MSGSGQQSSIPSSFSGVPNRMNGLPGGNTPNLPSSFSGIPGRTNGLPGQSPVGIDYGNNTGMDSVSSTNTNPAPAGGNKGGSGASANPALAAYAQSAAPTNPWDQRTGAFPSSSAPPPSMPQGGGKGGQGQGANPISRPGMGNMGFTPAPQMPGGTPNANTMPGGIAPPRPMDTGGSMLPPQGAQGSQPGQPWFQHQGNLGMDWNSVPQQFRPGSPYNPDGMPVQKDANGNWNFTPVQSYQGVNAQDLIPRASGGIGDRNGINGNAFAFGAGQGDQGFANWQAKNGGQGLDAYLANLRASGFR